MLRNIENQNSVALILSDLNIGLVVAAGSAIAHDLRLRERLLEMPREEFPGRPMLGKRPADPQPDTKRTYPGGGLTDAAATSAAESASASPASARESPLCSLGIRQRFPRTVISAIGAARRSRSRQAGVERGWPNRCVVRQSYPANCSGYRLPQQIGLVVGGFVPESQILS